ncbi:MAG: 50S ribosomal protein L6, partial [Thermoplasmatota archaeon]
MAEKEAKETVVVPSGVNVTLAKGGKVTVKAKATLERTFEHHDVKLVKEGDHILVSGPTARRKTKALVGTYAAHLRNMIAGSQKDFEYHLKIVYAHFPIKTKVQGDILLIENFLGEKTPRKARIMPGAKVETKGEEVIVKGPDVEHVSQTAANIEQACKIRGFDPRVFQDGIYITVKGA